MAPQDMHATLMAINGWHGGVDAAESRLSVSVLGLSHDETRPF